MQDAKDERFLNSWFASLPLQSFELLWVLLDFFLRGIGSSDGMGGFMLGRFGMPLECLGFH